jgi:phosphoenolpyruvate synthase/pyruvate phosphate dikinase
LMDPPASEPLFLASTKVNGDAMPSMNGENTDVLQGNAGSPGKVSGPARIIRSLDQAGRLAPGDILVAETTAPPWTPLFATAAAVVTDVGGVLSHCAVVAREYGIPAVVGAGRATELIQDGQLIEVNGDQGVVRLVA